MEHERRQRGDERQRLGVLHELRLGLLLSLLVRHVRRADGLGVARVDGVVFAHHVVGVLVAALADDGGQRYRGPRLVRKLQSDRSQDESVRYNPFKPGFGV